MKAVLERGLQVLTAFLAVGFSDMRAYPLGFIVGRLSSFVTVIMSYFVAQLVAPTSAVGGDYFSFVIIGTVSITVMNVGLNAFVSNLDFIIQQGRFESYLVEPVSWRLLPFGIGAWPMLVNTFLALTMGVVAVFLGASYDLKGLPAALLVLALGVLAAHAVGVLASSVKVIAKRGDPVIGIYTMLTALLSGAMFPLELLPAPLRAISYGLPSTYVIGGVRRILMPGGEALEGPGVGMAVLMLLGFILVVYPIALAAYGRSMEYGRRMGLLGGY